MTVSEMFFATERPPAERFDVALLDLDGVVYRGPDAVEHAAAAIALARSCGLRTMYVTNNANRSPGTVADHLTELDIPTTPEEVTTAAQAAARLIASDHAPGTKVLVIGGDGLREAVESEGFVVVDSADDGPAVVVQGFAPTVGWHQLSEAVLAIAAGAEHIASNLDATLPTERGMALGNGSLVAAVVNATGSRPRSTGKPQPEIFHQAAERAGSDSPIAVGDRLDTDLAGARAAGYPGMHVLTGVDDAAAVMAAPPALRPSMLALDLRGLLAPHPAVTTDGERFRCGIASARIVDGVVELGGDDPRPLTSGSEIDLDEFRAACAAAWTAADAGNPARPVSRIAVRERPQDVGAIA